MPNQNALRKVVQRARYIDRKPPKLITKTSPKHRIDFQYLQQQAQNSSSADVDNDNFVLSDFNVGAEEQVSIFGCEFCFFEERTGFLNYLVEKRGQRVILRNPPLPIPHFSLV